LRCRILVRARALTRVFIGAGRRRHAFILALAFPISLGSTEFAFEVQIPVALAALRELVLAALELPLDVVLLALEGARGICSVRAMAAIAIGLRRDARILGPTIGPGRRFNLKPFVNVPTTDPLEWSSKAAPAFPLGVRQVPAEA
jgi:hypothetical protein